MRIALLTELFPPSLGGQELFFAGLGRALAARGHEVEIFSVAHAEGLAAEEAVDGLRIYRHPVAPTYTAPPRAWMKRSWPAIFRYALWTRRRLRGGEHDLVLLNQWPLLHAVTLPRAARRRAILHWCEVRDDPFHRTIQRWLPRLTADNAAISHAVAEAIGAASGRPFFVLPSGLDLAAYAAPAAASRRGLLSLGRVAAHKNLPLLVAAFEALRERGYPDRLTIAGDGPAMPELRHRVATSPAREEIDILGTVDDATRARLLAESALLALTSRREGFPRVVAEAMASGLPVVTTDDPGNGAQTIVAASGCGVVARADPQSLADAAEAALAEADRHAEAGRAYAASLDWDRIAAQLEQRAERLPRRAAQAGPASAATGQAR
ncbi:glycosyl transferase family 1 [Kaistia sp. 32K]|uniref:glycosyltransferase family 4 protein n=1 Tax=Kaistia sp. 32K TaxID=2795690 RepID=UPI0019158092|nr:glycosyltransferase family 4 protein [Kaistia sp. 32K]BCP51443.1 glycosyl transferase family 1 [Kaistia sp. 32K]